MPRLKSVIRIAAHIQRAQAGGAFAHVARRGDATAGAIAVKLYIGGRKARLFVQRLDEEGRQRWRSPFGDDLDADYPEDKIDDWLRRESDIDPDIWVLEIEDSAGRGFLEDM